MSRGFHLSVGDGHALWVEAYGNPAGVPVLFLHGGPGSGCNPSQRALFDPARHWVIFVDQRGAGRSLPARSREVNTTAHLIADLERIRAHFGIARWLVVGGSWGATLALAYAQAHPAPVLGLVLRATFLGTMAELDWAFGTGLATFHPRLHAALAHQLGRDGLLATLWAQILDPDPAIHAPAARLFHQIERTLSELVPPAENAADGAALPATPFMEAHYFSQDCFLAPDQLLREAGRLKGIPGRIVQARYDLLCPPATAHKLLAHWPEARLTLVEAAGHSLAHPAIAAAVTEAVAGLAAEVTPPDPPSS